LSSSLEDFVNKYFIEKAELFRIIMDSGIMVERARKLAKYIAKQLVLLGIDSGVLLDVGCGTGRVALALAEIGYRVVGVDISPEFIEVARRRAKDRDLGDKAEFILCDARNLLSCLGNRRFDAALFVWSSVIGYYDEDTDAAVLRQVRELVRNGGALLFIDFVNRDYIAIASAIFGARPAVYDYGDHVVVESIIFNPVLGEVLIRQLFYRKSGPDLLYVGDSRFKMRVYSISELVKLARRSGWCLNRVLRDPGGEPGYSMLKPLNLVFTPCRE